MNKSIGVIAAVLTLGSLPAVAQDASTNATATATNTAAATNTVTAANTPATPVETEARKKLTVSASVYTYVVADGDDYVQPTVRLDYDRWHVEGRYNYEAQDSGSVWLGYKFSGGDKLEWELTPMIGGIFGDVEGVAPGYLGALRWKRFELYSEGEYVFDTDGSDYDYFYSWSELTFAPTDWFWFGIVGQRTRAYDADRDIQRGLLVGAVFRRVSFVGYVLNPDSDDTTYVASIGFGF
jgi:hypothetical protein